MLIHSRHQELAFIATEIGAAIEMMERYRQDLADPEARDRWHGIWLAAEGMLDFVFEEEAKLLLALGHQDWLTAANAHGLLMSFVRTVISQCEDNSIHRRANLSALEDILLVLSAHKARYQGGEGTSAPADHRPLRECRVM